MVKVRLSTRWIGLILIILGSLSTLVQFYATIGLDDSSYLSEARSQNIRKPRCAILLFGLPRAFSSVVLPSFRKNVLLMNDCDYFVHYYVQSTEHSGRSGAGGHINPLQVLQLKDAVQKISPNSAIEFGHTTEENFWKEYGALTHKIRTTNHTDGMPLYYPYKARTYKSFDIMDNIVKMWHSINESWKLMALHEKVIGQTYHRVAIMRVDVVYVTPVHIYQTTVGGKTHSLPPDSPVTILPGFGRFPVNDRSVIGPRNVAEIWATRRFSSLEQHVQDVASKNPGWGLHSERFVAWTLIPLMKKAGARVVNDERLCFLRARADESIWVSDCNGADATQAIPDIVEALDDVPAAIESSLGRSCHRPPFKVSFSVRGLWCPLDPATAERPLEWAPRGRKQKAIL